jgi:hypothetical protein
MKSLYSSVGVIALLFLAMPGTVAAETLQQETVKAWESYLRNVDANMHARAVGGAPFLWVDEAADRAERLRKGEILVSAAGDNCPEKVAHGLIHHWVGAAFIPGAGVNDVLAVVQDYDRYKDFYAPNVINTKRLGRAPVPEKLEQKFSLLWVRKILFVTAAIDTDYESRYVQAGAKRWYVVTQSTRVQQIDKYGQSGQRELPPDEGSGYIWRIYTIARFEQRDGGVYAELEVLGLTRDIPPSVGWLLHPVVQRLPRDAMTAILQKTKNAVQSSVEARKELRESAGPLPIG